MRPVWRAAVRTGFHLLYHDLAFTYDLVSWAASLGAWRCWTESALRHLPPHEPVLELAHGPGHLQVALAERGVRACAIDFSPQMGRQAQRRLTGRGLPARLARSRAEALPFAGESFAALISTFPTDFILDPRTLGEARRVLRPGAPLIIVPSAAFTGRGAGEAALEWAYRVTGQRTSRGASLAQVADYFTPHGFAVEMFAEPCPRSTALVIVARKSP